MNHTEQLKARVKELEADAAKTCEWTDDGDSDTYVTGCTSEGHTFHMELCLYGNNYCPNCGRKIKEVRGE